MGTGMKWWDYVYTESMTRLLELNIYTTALHQNYLESYGTKLQNYPAGLMPEIKQNLLFKIISELNYYAI